MQVKKQSTCELLYEINIKSSIELKITTFMHFIWCLVSKPLTHYIIVVVKDSLFHIHYDNLNNIHVVITILKKVNIIKWKVLCNSDANAYTLSKIFVILFLCLTFLSMLLFTWNFIILHINIYSAYPVILTYFYSNINTAWQIISVITFTSEAPITW